jgi:hypothetical protein
MNVLYSAYTNYQNYLNYPPSSPPTVWFYNRNNSNRYWEYSFQKVNTAWPATGMRQGRHASGKWIGGQLKYSGTNSNMGHGYYWTSTPWDENENAAAIQGASYNITVRDTVLYEITYGANADAYPVRCVRMTTP